MGKHMYLHNQMVRSASLDRLNSFATDPDFRVDAQGMLYKHVLILDDTHISKPDFTMIDIVVTKALARHSGSTKPLSLSRLNKDGMEISAYICHSC